LSEIGPPGIFWHFECDCKRVYEMIFQQQVVRRGTTRRRRKRNKILMMILKIFYLEKEVD